MTFSRSDNKSACLGPDCQYQQEAQPLEWKRGNQTEFDKVGFEQSRDLHKIESLHTTMQALEWGQTQEEYHEFETYDTYGGKTESSGRINGPFCTMIAVTHLLSNLYDDPILSNLKVCTLKDDEKSGLNTSVTMGFAKSIPDAESMIVLNFGTGPPKFQMYEKTAAKCRVVKGGDLKGVMGQEVSPSSVPFMSYTPTVKETRETEEQFITKNHEWFQQCMNKLDVAPTTPVYAVVTGTVRQHYYDETTSELARQHMKMQINTMLNKVTGNRITKPTSQSSYFITQQEEGQYEFAAVDEVVRSLDPNAVLVFGMGIGRGSAQLPYKSIVNDNVRVVEIKKGMAKGSPFGKCDDHPAEAKTIFYQALENWKGPNGTRGLTALEDIKRRCVAVMTRGQTPVLGLKSGALIHFGLWRDGKAKKPRREVTEWKKRTTENPGPESVTYEDIHTRYNKQYPLKKQEFEWS